MGLPAHALADLAYQFALGGIDIIKDDHGLADQSFAPFKERVELDAPSRLRGRIGKRDTGASTCPTSPHPLTASPSMRRLRGITARAG